jgi:hypothetical protein
MRATLLGNMRTIAGIIEQTRTDNADFMQSYDSLMLPIEFFGVFVRRA